MKKQFIVVIGIFSLLILLIFITCLNNNNDEYYLVFDKIASYECLNGNCKIIDNDILKSKNIKYTIYDGDFKYDECKINFANVINIFDKNNNWIKNNNLIFAISNNKIYEKIDTYEKKISEEEIVELKSINNIVTDSNLRYIEVESFNIDNDYYKIVFATNNDYEEISLENKAYNILYMKKNDEIKVILNETFNGKDCLDYPYYSVYGVGQLEKKYNKLFIYKRYFSEVNNPEIIIQDLD